MELGFGKVYFLSSVQGRYAIPHARLPVLVEVFFSKKILLTHAADEVASHVIKIKNYAHSRLLNSR